MSLKKLLVIHPENNYEDDSEKCEYLETEDHRRVLKEDIELLDHKKIKICEEDKKRGFLIDDEMNIPEYANAILVEENLKRGLYSATYCFLKGEKDLNFSKKKTRKISLLGLIIKY